MVCVDLYVVVIQKEVSTVTDDAIDAAIAIKLEELKKGDGDDIKGRFSLPALNATFRVYETAEAISEARAILVASNKVTEYLSVFDMRCVPLKEQERICIGTIRKGKWRMLTSSNDEVYKYRALI